MRQTDQIIFVGALSVPFRFLSYKIGNGNNAVPKTGIISGNLAKKQFVNDVENGNFALRYSSHESLFDFYTDLLIKSHKS